MIFKKSIKYIKTDYYNIPGIELRKALLYGVTSMGDKCERLDKVLEFFG